MIPVQKKGPAWMRSGKHHITLDPTTDDGISRLLKGYTLKKKHTEFPLKIRVDEYNSADKPAKFVTMFSLDTHKGKVEAPTIEDLMDKLDQQQLRWKSVGGHPNLFISDSLYANDKVLELEYLVNKSPLNQQETERLSELRRLLIISGESPKPTGPRPTAKNAVAKASAANAAAGAIGSQASPAATGAPTSTTVPQENTTAAAARAAMAEANRLTAQLQTLNSKNRKNLTATLRGTTRKLNDSSGTNPTEGINALAGGNANLAQKTAAILAKAQTRAGTASGPGGSGESLAERIARLSKLNIKGLNHRNNPGGSNASNTGSNGGNTPRSTSSSQHTPILSANDEELMERMSDEAMAAAIAKGLKKGTPEYDTFVEKFIEDYDVTKKGGKRRTRHRRNRRNKTKRNKTNRH
jgi:hypothetical protein